MQSFIIVKSFLLCDETSFVFDLFNLIFSKYIYKTSEKPSAFDMCAISYPKRYGYESALAIEVSSILNTQPI